LASMVILMNRKPKAIIEGLLFASGDSIPLKRLAEVLEMSEAKTNGILQEMMEEFNNNDERGIHIIRLEDSYQLCTKREYYDYIHLLRERNRRSALTNAGLEVLSVVAYNQPVTRSAIEFIRGVNSDGPLNNLVAAGLVREMGRLDAPGRPILFGTTEEFLRCFNLSSLSELPDIEKEYSFEGLSARMDGGQILTEDLNENQTSLLDFDNDGEETSDKAEYVQIAVEDSLPKFEEEE